MTARLLTYPTDLGLIALEPTNGPQVVGATGSQTLGKFTQTVASVGFAWEFSIAFPPVTESGARALRGFVMASHGGANAFRFKLIDADQMTSTDFGLAYDYSGSVPFDDSGQPFDNNMGWQLSPPDVAIAEAAAIGATTVKLANDQWGYGLEVGTQFGFAPFHFGFYMVTEVIADGEYRIFPPLAKALTTDDYATLTPVIVLRLKGQDAARLPRKPGPADGVTIEVVQVLDYDVRDYFIG